jgi:DNA-binding NarL/FixJ family response regulator
MAADQAILTHVGPAVMVTSRHRAAAKARLAGQEAGGPMRIDESPAERRRAVAEARPLLLIGAASFVTVQVRRQSRGPVEAVPEPFSIEELVAKLTLLAMGTSNAAIARRCRIEVGTVKAHMRAILRELGAHHRSEAVAIAKDLALL